MIFQISDEAAEECIVRMVIVSADDTLVDNDKTELNWSETYANISQRHPEIVTLLHREAAEITSYLTRNSKQAFTTVGDDLVVQVDINKIMLEIVNKVWPTAPIDCLPALRSDRLRERTRICLNTVMSQFKEYIAGHEFSETLQ